MNTKIKIFLFCVSALLIGGLFLLPEISTRLWRNLSAEAASGFPYQIGLTKVVIVPCYTTGSPPVCVGGTLCTTKDAATCALYSDVSGTPAGGMGTNALFLKTVILKAGLVSGGQLIAGGMSPVLMDSGVLASAGGCSGCLAKSDWKNNLVKAIDGFIIAGKKK